MGVESLERKMGGWLMVALAAAASIVMAAAATSHVVGGSGTGWTIPSNATFYSQWASTQNFAVGDTLVFNFPTGIHNVIKVSKSSYDACSAKNQMGSTLTTGPATVTISTAGNHYYICGVSGHCSFGQKLAISVASATSSSGPTHAPTAGSPTAPLAPSSSTSAGPPSSNQPTTATAPSSNQPTAAAVPSSNQPTITVPSSNQPTAAAGPSSNQPTSVAGPYSNQPTRVAGPSSNQPSAAAAGPSSSGTSSALPSGCRVAMGFPLAATLWSATSSLLL